MVRGATLLWVAIVCLPSYRAAAAETKRVPSSGAFLAGWDDFVLDGADTGAGLVELRLHLSGEAWDNLRQSPSSSDPEPVTGARTEARLTYRPFGALPFKAHVETGRLTYDGRPATSAFGAGLAFEGERHALHLSGRLERDRTSLDIGFGGDVTNDATILRLRYALRTKRVEWWAGGDHARQRFAQTAVRDGQLQGVQTGLSFTGLSRRVTPELVFTWSRNDTPGDTPFDWQQRRAQVGLRYTPSRSVALSGRFELSSVAWGVTRSDAVNFARRDHRRFLGLQAQIRVLRQAAWTLVYDRLQNTSTRDNRDFEADSVAASLTLRLGSTSTPATPNAPRGPRPPVQAPHPGPRAETPKLEPIEPPVDPLAAVSPEAPPAIVDAGALGVTRIETVHRGADTETTLRGEGLVRYTTLDLDGPPRFVLDLVGVAAAPHAITVDTPLVRAIRIGAFQAAPTPVARVVFDLKAPVAARIERQGDRLRIVLHPLVARASGPPLE